MLSGLDDTVIPSSHMAELWEVASTRNPPRRLRSRTAPEYIPPQNDMFQEFPYGQHSEFCLSPFLYIFIINRTLRYNCLSIWVLEDSFSIFG
jgi:hypothetical protein